MIISNIPGLSSMSTVKAKVDLYNGSTLVKTCTCGDVLSDFTVTREGENGKFFGFGICHKLDLHLIDLNKELTSVAVGNTAEIGLGDGGSLWDAPYPTFYIDEIERDEKSSTITGTAYDKIYEASAYSFDDLGLTAPYSLVQVAQAIATKLGIVLSIDANIYSAFRTICTEGANIDEASEKDLRTVLNWLAEATQSIYFINYLNELVFRRLDKDGLPVSHITQNDYYELNTKTSKTLTGICNTTELGDNLEASIEGEGVTQYIRSNPFLELNESLPTILDTAIAAIGGITIAQFDCDWVGNYLLEACDKIALTTDDGSEVYSYIISDKVTYGGTLDESTEWAYVEQTEAFANPTNIGEKISQTFAKVDKVNKQIELLVSDVSETKENVASLTMTTEAINLLVTEHEKKIDAFEELETGQITDRMAQIEIELDGINAAVSSNTTQIQAANTEIAGVKQTTTSNTTRLSAVEANIDGINLTVSNQSSKITSLESTTQNQGTKITGLENTASELNDAINSNASDIDTLTETTKTQASQISALQVEADSISATVSNITETSRVSTENIELQIEQLTQEVSTKVTADDLTITVRNEIVKGVDKVETTTGYTFDNVGLTIEKPGREMKTQITEDGMTVYRDTTAVLTADNTGVDAKNLKASTYLVIGTNSRFENYGTTRTACFWIGD